MNDMSQYSWNGKRWGAYQERLSVRSGYFSPEFGDLFGSWWPIWNEKQIFDFYFETCASLETNGPRIPA